MKAVFSMSTRAVLGAAILALVVLSSPLPTRAQTSQPTQGPSIPVADILPPALPWHGKSEELRLPPDHEWATPSERDGLLTSPDYATTVSWLQRLAAASEELRMLSLGQSPEGRDIWMVIASSEGVFDAQSLRRSGKATVFAQAGIHSGEIDGKDAGMMLLRDMTVLGKKHALLDDVNFLFVPIFSVDAHERRSAFNRINQRGPAEMGWRTTARNLNLNRDYAKGETREMRYMLQALQDYAPDLYLDLHVTDGADYQYDITYGWNGQHAWSPSIARWLDEQLRPEVDEHLEEMGHIPGPLIFVIDSHDMSKGMYSWTASPRYSTGYGDACHLPSILLENHSLKPYPQRVLGTYVFLEGVLQAVARGKDDLRRAVAQDRGRHPTELPLAFEVPTDEEPETILFKAVRSKLELSPISGAPVDRWLGKPYEIEIPIVGNFQPTQYVRRPEAYLIPAGYGHLAERLTLHGIEIETLKEGEFVDVDRYRLPDAKVEENPFEGRMRVQSGEPQVEHDRGWFGPGSLRVPTDQPLGDLVMLLLEPQSSDSLFAWGYFLEILQRTEYFEAYAMEPMARLMMAKDPELEREFEEKLLSDSDFAGSARKRLEFFYERSPYYDHAYMLYPVARVME